MLGARHAHEVGPWAPGQGQAWEVVAGRPSRQPALRGSALSWPWLGWVGTVQNSRHLQMEQLQGQPGGSALCPHPRAPFP